MTNRCEQCKYSDDETKEVPISLTWYLDVARTLVKHLSNTYNNELELLKVLLEEE